MSFGAGEQHAPIPGTASGDPANDDFIAYLESDSPDPNGANVLDEDWTSLINEQTSRAAAATAPLRELDFADGNDDGVSFSLDLSTGVSNDASQSSSHRANTKTPELAILPQIAESPIAAAKYTNRVASKPPSEDFPWWLDGSEMEEVTPEEAAEEDRKARANVYWKDPKHEPFHYIDTPHPVPELVHSMSSPSTDMDMHDNMSPGSNVYDRNKELYDDDCGYTDTDQGFFDSKSGLYDTKQTMLDFHEDGVRKMDPVTCVDGVCAKDFRRKTASEVMEQKFKNREGRDVLSQSGKYKNHMGIPLEHSGASRGHRMPPSPGRHPPSPGYGSHAMSPPPGYGGFGGPPPGFGGHGMSPPPGFGGHGMLPPPGFGGHGMLPPPGFGGHGMLPPPGFGGHEMLPAPAFGGHGMLPAPAFGGHGMLPAPAFGGHGMLPAPAGFPPPGHNITWTHPTQNEPQPMSSFNGAAAGSHIRPHTHNSLLGNEQIANTNAEFRAAVDFFCSVTEKTPEIAADWLQRHNGDPNHAIQTFFNE